MARRVLKRIPRFYGFRIYAISTGLYYLLVLPFLLILTIKYTPYLRESGRFTINDNNDISDTIASVGSSDGTYNFNLREVNTIADSLSEIITQDSILIDSLPDLELRIAPSVGVSLEDANNPEPGGTQIGTAFNILFNLLLISFLIGFIFNLPFKSFFHKKRRGKVISKKLFDFCKKFLLKSPLINAGIMGLAFLAAHLYMLYILLFLNPFSLELERSLFTQFFYISLTASILSLLFVYYWEKHRVHIKYINYIYDEKALRKRIFNLRVGKIRNRMIVSSVMTTLLPFMVVILYLFLSTSSVGDINIDSFTDEHKNILFGDYMMFTDIFGSSSTDLNVPGWLFYINAINSFFMFIGIFGSTFIAFFYIIFLVKWTTQDIVEPIRELLFSMNETGKGELNSYAIVRTNDELGELTEGYNDMTEKLSEYIQSISNMTEAYSRFVPRQFLDFLGKSSYTDIKLGDQVQKEMTILFSDIRSFTQISEQMTPKENFNYINYYLGYMEPVIRNNNGFIDKYIGDSIMALFSDNAEDAINVAIEMRIKLSQFNQVMDQFGKPSIKSGIGIHSGSLMLGIVGGEGRMDGTVISDAVNLSSRLEGLTKLYGSSIIISQDTLIKLNNPTQYNYRFLDIVKVKGKSEAVYIFEVIDGDSEDVKQLKIKTKTEFADAINLYKLGKFEKALALFKEVNTINPHDKTAELYISRCEKFIEHGIPKNWDGIETIKWD